MFFYRFYIVLHHAQYDFLVNDLWLTLWSTNLPYERATVIELILNLIGRGGRMP